MANKPFRERTPAETIEFIAVTLFHEFQIELQIQRIDSGDIHIADWNHIPDEYRRLWRGIATKALVTMMEMNSDQPYLTDEQITRMKEQHGTR